MGKINKKLFADYLEFECDRKLFLSLAKGDRNLISPYREYVRLKRPRIPALAEFGRKYEQIVYGQLKKLKNVEIIYILSKIQKDLVIATKLNLDSFREITSILENEVEAVCLLEHELTVPRLFYKEILGMDPDQISPELVKESEVIRPDVIIIDSNKYTDNSKSVYEVLSDGSVRKLSEKEKKNRFSINIIDIKATNMKSVSKRHFIEIFYYAIAISQFLYENNLNNQFFVNIEKNGILANISNLHLNRLDELFSNTITFNWVETLHIYERVIIQIKTILKDIPKNIDYFLQVNIQAECGRCDYLDDCKESLGMRNSDSSLWDVRLLPYTSQSIAEQLIMQNLTTIKDVDLLITQFPESDVPNPIYTRKPLIALKAKALKENAVIYPQTGQIHSVNIPKLTEMALTFSIEVDPMNDRAFVMGLQLSMFMNQKRPYATLFEIWWGIWQQYLEKLPLDNVKREYELELILEQLKQNFNSNDIQNNNEGISLNITQVNAFANSLEILQDKTKGLSIVIAGDMVDGKRSQFSAIKCMYSVVNESITDTSEVKFTKNLLQVIHSMIIICTIIEEFVSVTNEQKIKICPTLAMFYWSTEQMNYFKELIERNFQYLITDNKIRPLLNDFINWLNPEESFVPNPQQHRKLYDLRAFAETTLGYPFVINYTWHEIAKHEFDLESNIRYWTPHFNYMDFRMWFSYLQETEPQKNQDKEEEIKRQIRHKIRILDKLRIKFQSEGRNLLSWKAQPVNSHLISSERLPNEFHEIANAWYLYSRLNGTVSIFECDYYRRMYPEYSVGKLIVGKVSNLEKYEVQKRGKTKYHYHFDLTGLSSNMKLREGDYVTLIPFELRDIINSLFSWKVDINVMLWDDNRQCYYIETDFRSKDVIEKATTLADEKGLTITDWYLYPFSQDFWSKKLYKREDDCLLSRQNIGKSSLGLLMSKDLQLFTNKAEFPDKIIATLSEIYIFSPMLLPTSNLHDFSLQTKVFPSPDSSQKAAIEHALSSIISVIQGPPGTGKSQTIVALIDEFLSRRNGQPTKILITSFSYAALRVLMDKCLDSKNNKGEETEVAKIQKVFLRSENQYPHQNSNYPGGITDLYRKGKTWKLNNVARIFTKNTDLIDNLDDQFILFGNAHQLYKLRQPDKTKDGKMFFSMQDGFDLIIVDEASQLPVDQFLASVELIHNHNVPLKIYRNGSSTSKIEYKLEKLLDTNNMTKLVIVGDHNQLPPVQPVKSPRNLRNILGSLFRYYVKGFGLKTKQLEINYRSHQDIVSYTSTLGFYQNLHAFSDNATKTIASKIDMKNYAKISDQWFSDILSPEKVVCSIIHDVKFDTGVSPLEAEITADLVQGFYQLVNPQTIDDQIKFWQQGIGIVAPHNAHIRLIIRKIFEKVAKKQKILLKHEEFMQLLKETVYTVEKFQGSDRDVIIASIGTSAKDQLKSEEEFLYELNRFNVLTSRAKYKVILVTSQNYLDYVPKDREIMKNASKIRKFALNFCKNEKNIVFNKQKDKLETIKFRWY